MFAAKLMLLLFGFESKEELERFDDSFKALLKTFNVNAVGAMEVADLSGKNQPDNDVPKLDFKNMN